MEISRYIIQKMESERKMLRGCEIFQGKVTQCRKCKKIIMHGENSFVVRRLYDNKVMIRCCFECLESFGLDNHDLDNQNFEEGPEEDRAIPLNFD